MQNLNTEYLLRLIQRGKHMSAASVASLSDVVLTDAQQVHKQVLSCEELSSKAASELHRLFAVSRDVW